VFNLKDLSPTAYLFMRTYITALRRDYDSLQAVLDLMDPENLGVCDALRASKMAIELKHSHAEFEKTLHATRSADKFFRRTITAGPAFADLAELFSMSFFNVLYSNKSIKASKPADKIDAGVFSGKPEEWHSTLKALQNNPLPSDDMFSACFSALSKLFPKFGGFIWHNADVTKDATLNFWPPKPPDSLEEDPFKWFSNDEDEEDEY
jgi:hypothetical protein